jgi:hypothetical protein
MEKQIIIKKLKQLIEVLNNDEVEALNYNEHKPTLVNNSLSGEIETNIIEYSIQIKF